MFLDSPPNPKAPNICGTSVTCHDTSIFTLRNHLPYGWFLKWWYPTTIGFPTKNEPFWGVWGGTTILGTPHIYHITGTHETLQGVSIVVLALNKAVVSIS